MHRVSQLLSRQGCSDQVLACEVPELLMHLRVVLEIVPQSAVAAVEERNCKLKGVLEEHDVFNLGVLEDKD